MSTTSFSRRLSIAFFVLTLILGGSVALTLQRVGDIESKSQLLNDLRAPTARNSLMLLNGVNHSLAALRGWMLIREEKFRVERQRAWRDEIHASLTTLRELSGNWTNPDNVARLSLLSGRVALFEEYQAQIEQLAHSPDNRPDLQLFQKELVPTSKRLHAALSALVDVEVQKRPTVQGQKLLFALTQLDRASSGLRDTTKAYLLSKAPDTAHEVHARQGALAETMAAVSHLASQLSQRQISLYQRITVDLALLSQLALQAVEIKDGDTWNRANSLLRKNAAPLAFEIKQLLSATSQDQLDLMTSDLASLGSEVSALETLEYLMLALGLTTSLALGFFNIRSMTSSLGALATVARTIASGELTQPVKIRGGEEVNRVASALEDMRRSLHQTQTSLEKRRALAVCLQQEETPDNMAREALTIAADTVGAVVGTMYLAEAEGSLRLAAGFQLAQDAKTQTLFKYGEGLVGRTARDNVTTVTSDIPQNSLTLRTGLGEVSPTQLVACPLSNGVDVAGVAVLGFLNPVSSDDLALLRLLLENVCSAYRATQANSRAAKLLMETREQSLQIEAQRVHERTNRQLAEQALVLRASEENLRKSNTELEARTLSALEQTVHLERQQETLKAQKLQLEKASQYKSEFLSNMSHELRTPLNSMLILAKMLADNQEGNLTKDQVDSASIVHSGGMELLELINEILDLSKIEAGKMTTTLGPVVLSDLCQALRSQFTPIAYEKGIELVIAEGSQAILRTDNQRLRQILKNLLSNALKFTQSGRVTLNISSSDPPEELASPELAQGALAFTVSDTGTGIPAEHQEAIFEAFQQVDGTFTRQQGGTGLGLTISRRLARLLRGDLTLESSSPSGSTFCLWLPCALSQTQPKTTDLRAAAQLNQNPALETGPESVPQVPNSAVATLCGKRVLLVDDDVRNAFALGRLLSRLGLSVDSATNGQLALNKLRADDAKFDLVLMDVMMPVLNGLEATRQIKADDNLRNLPVIVLTANAMPEDKDASLAAGADAFLTKPVDDKLLVDALKRWLEGSDAA